MASENILKPKKIDSCRKNFKGTPESWGSYLKCRAESITKYIKSDKRLAWDYFQNLPQGDNGLFRTPYLLIRIMPYLAKYYCKKSLVLTGLRLTGFISGDKIERACRVNDFLMEPERGNALDDNGLIDPQKYYGFFGMNKRNLKKGDNKHPLPMGLTWTNGEKYPSYSSRRTFDRQVVSCGMCHNGQVNVGPGLVTSFGGTSTQFRFIDYMTFMGTSSKAFLTVPYTILGKKKLYKLIVKSFSDIEKKLGEGTAAYFYGYYSFPDGKKFDQKHYLKQKQMILDELNPNLKESELINDIDSSVEFNKRYIAVKDESLKIMRPLEHNLPGMVNTSNSQFSRLVTMCIEGKDNFSKNENDMCKKYGSYLKGRTNSILSSFPSFNDIPSLWEFNQRPYSHWDGSIGHPVFRNTRAASAFIRDPELDKMKMISDLMENMPASPLFV